ncbi:MAG: hypothetical protein Q9217_005194 [Psora testacea]
MSGPLEATAAIVSFVGLTIQVFDGCIKGFVLLTEAQGLGSRADILVCQLEWEHFRFSSWAGVVGLLKTPPELTTPNPDLVYKTIANLEQQCLSVDKLKKEYGLDIKITEEEVREVNTSRRGLGRLLDKARPHFINDTAKVYSRRNNPWQKAKWGAVDADKFRWLLTDIGYFNQRLESLLHPSDRALTSQGYNHFMRSVVSQAPDQSILDAIVGPLESLNRAVAATAHLRQTGLSLDVITASHRQNASQTPAALPAARHINRGAYKSGTVRNVRKHMQQLAQYKGHSNYEINREMALYEQKEIIIEWKDVDIKMEDKLKYRVANVASFLAEMQDSSFHCLHCVGYVKASSNRYAYLFEPPILATEPYEMQSLADLMANPYFRPALNHRLGVAVDLAETILQLHTTGWLHKDVRPENVLFFNMTTKACQQKEPWNTYLGGYHFARADNPLETTEDPLSRDFSDLYRHPASLGSQRPSYRKEFDLYSFGCLLIEIALWEPFPTLLERHLLRLEIIKDSATAHVFEASSTVMIAHKKQILLDHRMRLLLDNDPGSVLAEVEYQAGTAYSRLIRKCMTFNEDVASGDDEFGSSVAIQELIVNTLRKIMDGIVSK